MQEIPTEVLRLALDATKAGVWQADYEQRTVTFSDRAYQLFGFGVDDPVTRATVMARIHPDDVELVETAARTSMDPRSSGHLDREFRVVLPGGSIRWLKDIGRTWFDVERSRPVRAAGILLDITDERLERAKIARREREFRTLAENSPDGVQRFDRDLRIVFVNRAMERISPYRASDMIGRRLGELEGLDPATVAEWEGRIRSVVERGELVTAQDTFVAGGEPRHLEVRLVPETGPDGRVESVLAITSDVTEARRLQSALAASEERHRLALEAVHGLMYDWDLATGTVERSSGLAAVTGYAPDDIPATIAWWRAQVHRDDLARLDRDHRGRSSDEAPARGMVEYRVRHREGHYVLILDRYVVVRDESGKPVRVVGCTVDVTEYRRAESAFKAGEERLRLAASAAGFGTYDYDAVSRVAYWSPEFRGLLGLPVGAEVHPQRVLERVHPDDREWVLAKLRRIISSGGPGEYETELRILLPDGSVRWMVDRGQVIRTGRERRAVRVVGAAVDITERKRAAEEIRLWADAFIHTAHGIAMGDPATNTFRAVNPAFAAMHGYQPHQMIGLPILETYAPEGRPVAQREIEKADRSGRAHFGAPHQRADGSRFDAEMDVVSVRGPDGRLLYRVATVQDVTDKKRTEAALLERQRFIQRTVDVAPLGIYVADLERHSLMFGNQLMWDSIGGQTMLGQPIDTAAIRARLHPDDRQRFADFIAAALVAQDDRLPDFEFRLQDPDGKWRWYRDSTAIFERAADGTPAKLIGARLDITEEKGLELELRGALDQLKNADRQKDEFLATLAHELRNPLAPIRNAVAILRAKAAPDPLVTRTRDLIDRQVTHLVRLVDDLLDLGRITSGKISLQRQLLDILTVVDSAVETTRPLIDAAGQQLVVTPPSEQILVEGDLTRLAQVVANLLNNAVKYTPRGGRIFLSIGRDDEQAVIRIADSGAGIPPEMLATIFDMFTQVDRTLERATGGLGIGLALVKRLVEMHGGSVEARSAGLGQGSEFVVRVPAATPPRTDPSLRGRTRPAGAERPIGGLKILIADDNRDAAQSLAMLLEIGGHEVVTAHDGMDALEAAKKARPDVALLDIGMPRMNGYDVAKALRERIAGNAIRLIAVTGWGQESDRRRSMEAGFDFHLTKPVDLAALERLLETETGREH